MIAPLKRKDLLLAETELLITGLVRDARLGTKVTADVDGAKVTTREPTTILDRVRAADAALRFIQIKNKLDPEHQESEFERLRDEFHDTGEGSDAGA
jgi:hypothetical protein